VWCMYIGIGVVRCGECTLLLEASGVVDVHWYVRVSDVVDVRWYVGGVRWWMYFDMRLVVCAHSVGTSYNKLALTSVVSRGNAVV